LKLPGAAFRRLWIAGIVLAVLVIVTASLTAMPMGVLAGGTDKIGHFFAYFTLMLLGAGIVAAARLWQVALRCLLLGVALEVGQELLTATRQADWADILANGAGILAGWLLASGPRAGWARYVEAWLARRG
jgi:VanZ family protein